MIKNNISASERPEFENSFGFAKEGKEIMCHTLKNKNGMEVSVITYGATITSIKVPLINGKTTDVVLGFNQIEDYENSFHLPNAPYLGAVVGRYAGRIKHGSFELQDSKVQLTQNHGTHHIHGGNSGFSQKIWDIKKVELGASPSITLEYVSPSGEEHYPGMVMAEVTYVLTENSQLIVKFHAYSTEDTIINLTQHSYFNLNGHENTVDDLELQLTSDKRLDIDQEGIPTGAFIDLHQTREDFSTPKKIEIPMDYTFPTIDNQIAVAHLTSTKNNLKMSVFTNQPAVHIYVGGNCFGQIQGKEGVDYHNRSGICFETQNFPDAPNHAHFPSALLKAGERYHHQTIFSFQNL
jgi:aldose 1-epimerase